MIARHASKVSEQVTNVEQEAVGQGKVRDNPVARSVSKKNINTVLDVSLLVVMREDLFRYDVLDKQDVVKMPTIKQLARIEAIMRFKQGFTVTMREMRSKGLYWPYSSLAVILEHLCKHRVLVRHDGGDGVKYSIGVEGRRLLGLYGAYLSGAHDDRLV